MPEDQMEKIDDLLKRRENVYPVRSETFFESKKEIGKYTEYLMKKADLEDWEPDKKILDETNRFIKNPIFICGIMKSGTSLVVNLLDGHKNIVALPGDSHYFRKFRKSENDFHALAKYWILRMINPTGQSPFWFLGRDEENYKNFLRYLRYFAVIAKKSPFASVVSAVFAANPSRPEEPLYFLEKTPNNEYLAEKLAADFPNAKFIHLIRDPLSNIASLKKLFKFRKWRFFSPFLAFYSKNSWKTAEENQKIIGKDTYFLIKYEDLLKNCRKEMKKICRFLDIEYNENLCVPTTNCRPAKANSMYKNERASGKIFCRKSDKWERELTGMEKSIIISTLFFDAVATDYSWNEDRVKKYFKRRYVFLFKPLYFLYRFFIRLRQT